MSSSPEEREEGANGRRRRNDVLEDSDDNGDEDSLVGARRSGDGRAARLARRAAQRRRLNHDVGQVNGSNIRLLGDDDDGNNNIDEDDNDNEDVDDASNIDEDDVDYHVAGAAPDEEEEEDGEDLLDNAERDYQRIEALDTYGTEGLDDTEYAAVTAEERQAAEAELARRETNRRQQGFLDRLGEDDEAEDEDARQARRRMFQRSRRDGQEPDGEELPDEEDEVEEEEEEDLDGDDQVNLEAFDVPLREWIAQDRTRREIARKFRVFLRHFESTGDYNNNSNNLRQHRRGRGVYEQKIRTMCAHNHSSLSVSYLDLMHAEPVLAYWLTDAPTDMFVILNEAATRHTLALFPSYHAIQSEIHVRISHVPILDSLRDLRRSHLDCLVKVHGTVTRRSTVYPQLQLAYYICQNCKNIQGPLRVDASNNDPSTVASSSPDECPNCEIPSFRLHPTLSLYRNVQRVNLQETPGSVPPGRVPRTKEVLMSDDLIDVARPGEEIEVTGVFIHKLDSTMTIQSGFPVFGTLIVANHVAKRHSAESADNLSPEDIAHIQELSRDPRIGERIVQSIAPSIYGQDNCKMALAMSLFGGVPKNMNDKHRIRGDVNVLLLGDPGTAKSQLLKYAERTAPRAVYSTGKGASAVGLTASVHKDPITREWTLEGGALVLADQGLCLIDEFDKMNEQDRTSIHEAMEQQSISISKAGIVTSLQARCAVIAAANPIGGRYDSANTLADNVELTDPILQRFDILCVLQDTVDPVADERLAQFVTSSHMRSIPTRDLQQDPDLLQQQQQEAEQNQPNRPDLIPQDMLRKYIEYARANIRPALEQSGFDQEKVSSLYVALRRESASSGGVPIAVRHIESMMRMAEAHAKMHLREHVRDDDMDAAIRMMLHSFIHAQKFSVRRALQRSFRKFISSSEDRAHLLLHILQDMFRKEQMYQIIRLRQRNQPEEMLGVLEVPLEDLESRARERRVYNVHEFCRSSAFAEAGYQLDAARGLITRIIT
ncbi:hypothetical protein ACA910_005976 [Epithemia clementina (nom. ined.)]